MYFLLFYIIIVYFYLNLLFFSFSLGRETQKGRTDTEGSGDEWYGVHDVNFPRNQHKKNNNN